MGLKEHLAKVSIIFCSPRVRIPLSLIEKETNMNLLILKV